MFWISELFSTLRYGSTSMKPMSSVLNWACKSSEAMLASSFDSLRGLQALPFSSLRVFSYCPSSFMIAFLSLLFRCWFRSPKSLVNFCCWTLRTTFSASYSLLFFNLWSMELFRFFKRYFSFLSYVCSISSLFFWNIFWHEMMYLLITILGFPLPRLTSSSLSILGSSWECSLIVFSPSEWASEIIGFWCFLEISFSFYNI